MTGTKIAVNGAETKLLDMKLKTLQHAVGGNIEIFHLGNGKIMIVNEDGFQLNLPVNARAMDIAAMAGPLCQPLVGNVVVCDETDME